MSRGAYGPHLPRAVWLASDYILGASIFVDGGMTLYPGFETGG